LVGDVILTPCSTEEDDNCDADDDDGCVGGFVVTSIPDLFDDGTSGNCGNAVCPYALLIHMTLAQLIERIIPNTISKVINLVGLATAVAANFN
jgi:hypothetical protein